MKKYYIKIIQHAGDFAFHETSVLAEDFQFRGEHSIIFYIDNVIVAVYPAVNTIIDEIKPIKPIK